MKVSVIGLGYIGLPTALVMAANGVNVVGVDLNQHIVDQLNAGHITFEEKGLDELFQKAVSRDIKFQTSYPSSDIYIVAVPTPYDKDTKKVNAKYIISAVESILEVANENAIVVIESTISPGVIDKYVRPIIEESKKLNKNSIHIAHCPERIIPGNMVYELEHNSRTIGVDEVTIGDTIKNLYETFCKGEILITDIRTAELSKVVENTFRDVNIAFANELSRLCNEANVDVHEVIKVANHHPRVNILYPGPGVGGHCISVDPWFLVGDYPEMTPLIRTAREVNDSQPMYVWNRALEFFNENGLNKNSKIGIYGLTYKENVDDTRESPTLQLLEQLSSDLEEQVIIYDPYIDTSIAKNQYFEMEKFIDDSDFIIIFVAHDELQKHIDQLNTKIIYDTKRIMSLESSSKIKRL